MKKLAQCTPSSCLIQTSANKARGSWYLLAFALLLWGAPASGQAPDWVVQPRSNGTPQPFFMECRALAADAAGNVYATGFFQGTSVDFDPGAGTANLVSAGKSDIFIAKYNASGNYVWARRVGGPDEDQGLSLALDGSGNLVVTGYFMGPNIDFDPGAGTANLPWVSAQDIFIAKYDTAGNYVWAKQVGGAIQDAGHKLALDGSGNVYLTGYFMGANVDFDPGAGLALLSSSANAQDIFFAKYDASGNYVWAKRIGNADGDFGYGIAVDASSNVYVSGLFMGTNIDFDPGAGSALLTAVGGQDLFFAKYDASGNYVWAKRIGGTSHDIAYDLVLDGSGNLYLTGVFRNPNVDFDPGAGAVNYSSAGEDDIFLGKYTTASGDYVWAKAIGGTGLDQAHKLALDGSGNVYLAGLFNNGVDFDPGAGTAFLSSAGAADICMARYTASGNYVWAKRMGGASADRGLALTLSSAGKIVIGGGFDDTADFDPGPGTTNRTATALFNDIFIAQYALSPDINVKGNAVSITDGDTSPATADDTDFGNICTEGGTNPNTFTIENTGLGDLTLASGSITFTGTGAGSFALSGITLPATVAPGQSTTFVVTFNPSSSGQFDAKVNIATNDPDENPYDFDIRGTRATAPAFSSCPSGPIVVNTAAGQCTAAVNYTATATNSPTLTYTFSGATTGSGTGTGSDSTFRKGNTVVTITATNTCGTTTCTFTVTVVDNQAPTVSCPANKTVQPSNNGPCSATVSGNNATVSDNCSGSVLSYTLSGATTGSGSGQVGTQTFSYGTTTVTYTVTDGSSLSSNCTFTVTVADTLAPTVSCPTNQTVPPSTNGPCSATVSGIDASYADNCNGAVLTYSLNGVTSGSGSGQASGQTFLYGLSTVTYTVTDAANLNSSCTFTVTVADTLAPTVSCPTNQTVPPSTNGPCSATVGGIDATYADNCNGAVLSYALSGVTTGSGSGQASGQTFLYGVSTVTYTVTDAANLSSSCTFTVTVADTQAPTVGCPANQTVLPDTNSPCSATVGGINAGYADNCNGAALTFALSGATAGSGSGQASGQTFLYGVTIVTYTVTDVANLNSSCTFTVTVAPVNLVFSGKIRWENDGVSGVNNATVSLTGAATGSDLSDTNGDYLISIPATTGNFTLKPTKTANKLNGVTSADATAIQQHIASSMLLPAPYKRIAADVNKSNTITSLDAILINQALLGNASALSQITSWRFVDAAYTFPNPSVPWGFPEQINLTGVVCDQTGKDFTGIKLGDVTSGWANPANFGQGEPLVWRVQDRMLKAGEPVTVEFRADQLNDVSALQFVLLFHPGVLQFEAAETLGGLPLTADNFGLYNVAGGEIRLVWNNAQSAGIAEATPVFRLRFTTLEGGKRLHEVLNLDETVDSELPARVYNSAFAESAVTLQYWEATGTAAPEPGTLALQNRPNPFSDATTMEFVLPESCTGQLRIFDATGKEWLRLDKSWPAGRNTEILRLEARGASGVLYGELITPFGTETVRMLRVGGR